MSSLSRLIWIAAAATPAFFLSALRAFAQTMQEIERAAAETVRELSLQTELPLTQAQIKAPWTVRNILPDWLANMPLGTWIIWVAVFCLLAFLLYTFRNDLPILRWGRRKSWDEDPLDAQPGAHPLSNTAISADELAQQGHYVEAMHLLLLRAIAETRQKLGAHFADSLTSREILRKAPLTDPGRTLLHDIIRRVEWSYFGQYPAVGDDYAACRESFNRFLATLPESARA